MTDAEFTAFLNGISNCFIKNEFEAWESRVRLPFSMVTKVGPVVLRTREELKRNFDLYVEACNILQLDQVVREPLGLEDCDDGTWIGTYKTHLLSRGKWATEPYTSSALLHWDGSGWRMSSILNARGHHTWTKRNPSEEIG